MTKRMRARRFVERCRDGLLTGLTRADERRRRNWTFERLEARHFLSANSLLPLESDSLSSDSAEQLLAILEREIYWAAAQYENTGAFDIGVRQLPNDPLVGDQWHLLNTAQLVGNPNFQDILGVPGEDINVLPVWEQGITGEGIIVGVVDSGVQISHPDLAANIHPTLQFNALTLGGNQAPNENVIGDAHGTAVAGLLAAVANNGIGVAGVAYDSQIAPIRLITETGAADDEDIAAAISFATQEIDIYNHSWGPSDATRAVAGPGPDTMTALRNSIFFGRGGLGNIHVFAAGNGAQSTFAPGFGPGGVYDGANHDGFVNSRYTIGIGGVDHDGGINNVDGTTTTYPEGGPAIFAVAPTGSFPLQIGEDGGIGSGIWTTDFLGDDGFNQAPLPNGFEIDNDFLEDTDYTSRFNGTSASTPIASGVIALMLQVNPNLSWRDVQEIIVRSARQNAQFEVPGTGSGTTGDPRFVSDSTWVTNAAQLFRDPDPLFTGPGSFFDVYDPLWKADNFFFDDPQFPNPESGFNSPAIYAPPSPSLFTNGAGYTVSHGRGPFAEEIGYGHGVLDAQLAVQMAQQWNTLNQSLPAERTWTTFVQNDSRIIKAGEVGNDESGNIIVPGGIAATDGGFIDHWNAYFADTPPDPFPGNSRGFFIQTRVPDSQAMSIETVEVRVSMTADNSLDHLKLDLVSPGGTHSLLSNYFDAGAIGPGSLQQDSWPGTITDPPGTMNPGDLDPTGQFVWTFTTNRAWGERSDPTTVIDPATGEPFLNSSGESAGRTWELHMENFSGENIPLQGVEIVFHGSPVAQNSKRVQGFVGIDENQDGAFNFDRFLQTTSNSDGDGVTNRQSEVMRIADVTQESFAPNIVVEAVRTSDGLVVDRFLTGDDGNFYFDLVPGDYTLRVANLDPALGELVGEQDVPAGQLPFFRTEWQITEDWFFAPEKVLETFEALDADGNVILNDFTGLPEEFQRFRAEDDGTGNPVPFTFVDFNTGLRETVENNVYGINFLIDAGEPIAPEFTVNGFVYADNDGNEVFDDFDIGLEAVDVYADLNGNGVFDPVNEPVTQTQANGTYSLNVPAELLSSVGIGVLPPNGWTVTTPADGLVDVLAGPGEVVNGVDLGLLPPVAPGPPGSDGLGRVLGAVFNDLNGDGDFNLGDTGVAGLEVYLDLNLDGDKDPGEPASFTTSNGAYAFADVPLGTVQVRINAPASFSITTPVAGFHQVAMPVEGTFAGLDFGVQNLAVRDFGDLVGYPTLEIDGGPWHAAVEGFSLGALLDGELDGQPTPGADGDDLTDLNDEDGIRLVTAAGSPIDGLGNPIIIQPGTNYVEVVVNGFGGLLQGFMDFDGDGNFLDSGEQIFSDVDLAPGTYILPFTATGVPDIGPVAARFRWGEAGLGFAGGSIFAGEVEDYLLPTSLAGSSLAGDFDGSGTVDDDDRMVWKTTFGSTSDLRADANLDGVVNLADYTMWRDHVGETTGGGSGVGARSGNWAKSIAKAPTTRLAQADPRTDFDAYARELGFVPMTINVGLGRTQTMYQFVGVSSTDVTPVATAAVIVDAGVDTAGVTEEITPALSVGVTRPAERVIAAPPVLSAVSDSSSAVGVDLELLDRVLAGAGSSAEADRPFGQDWLLDDENELDDEGVDSALAVAIGEEIDWRVTRGAYRVPTRG